MVLDIIGFITRKLTTQPHTAAAHETRHCWPKSLVASSSLSAAPLAQRSGSAPVSPTAGRRHESKRSTTLTLMLLPSCMCHWASDTTCLSLSGFMPCSRQRSRRLIRRPRFETQMPLLFLSKQGHLPRIAVDDPSAGSYGIMAPRPWLGFYHHEDVVLNAATVMKRSMTIFKWKMFFLMKK